MKNNIKGFTLIELIAVIIIISVISIMSFASITRTIKNSELKKIETFEANLKTAAQIYIETNLTDFPALNTVGGNIQITASTLITNGYLDKSIDNPTDCELKDTFVYVFKQGDKTISYSVYCVGDTINTPIIYTKYANGTPVYYNPVTGAKCDAASAVSTTGTKTGCMKWYTFGDISTADAKVNLILDHNTTAVVAWNSTGSNVSGPVEVLTQLKADTDSWAGVTTRIDSYGVSNGTATYTINYSTYKARLISANEIANITKNAIFKEATSTTTNWFYLDSNNQTQTATSAGASNYDYLFDYTNNCTSYGCNLADASTYGFWTSTAISGDASGTWRILFDGTISAGNVNVTGSIGVRPVITINKTSIQ